MTKNVSESSESALKFGHTKRQARWIVMVIAITFFVSEGLFWVVQPVWAKVLFESVGLLMFVLLCINVMHLLIDPLPDTGNPGG